MKSKALWLQVLDNMTWDDPYLKYGMNWAHAMKLMRHAYNTCVTGF